MINVPERVKDALKQGSYRKNYRFIIYDGETELFTIDNNNLVAESVVFDEKLCSTTELKFGLCEGATLEFQYFGFPNIKGKRVQTFIDVQYVDENKYLQWHEIPMGWFDVEKCPRREESGLYKATCFNKLMSDYFDNKINEKLVEIAKKGDSTDGKISLGTMLWKTLIGYSIEPPFEDVTNYEISYILWLHSLDREEGLVGNLFFSTHPMYTEGKNFYPYGVKIEIKLPEINAYYRCKINYKKLQDLLDTDIYNGKIDIKCANPQMYQQYDLQELRTDADITYGKYIIDGLGTYWEWLNKKSSVLLSDEIEHTSDICYVSENADERIIKLSISLVQNTSYTLENAFKITKEKIDWLENNISEIIKIEKRIITQLDGMRFTLSNVETWSDVTLRELQSATFELNAQYGQLDRKNDLFSGVTLGTEKLLPSEDLYPSENLYPKGSSERTTKTMYKKLWTDDFEGVKKYRNVIVEYLGTDEDAHTKIYPVNEDGNIDYEMKDNWLFNNLKWTEQQIDEYMEIMISNLSNVQFIDFEMELAGLPYLETGDELQITTKEGTFTSYILQRSLSGIQNLKDRYYNGNIDSF